MENASKALLIAGEILIAILILGILVYGYNNLSYFSKEQEISTEKKQLVAFNREYESYNRKLLRGVEVISVMNKAISNNEKYKDNLDYYGIEITFEMVEAVNEVFNAGRRYSQNNFASIKIDSDAFSDFKRRIFDCIEISYNEKSGRVNKMHFKERKMKDIEYNYGIK